jgi:hypothetical protein
LWPWSPRCSGRRSCRRWPEVVEPGADDTQPLLLERGKVTDGGGDLAKQQVLAK